MRPNLVWIGVFLLCISCSGPSWGIPKIQYCVSFWAKNITCYWELLPEMGPSAMYTLHITEEAGRCRRDFGETGKCVASQGEHSCSVAVENPFAFYKIQLTVESEQARASSSEKCVHGMSIVKLSPPVVNAVVANQSRCFQLEWSSPANELLSATEAQYEIRYRDTAEISWTQLNFTLAENTSAQLNICGLFPFTRYSVQLRAKYLHRSYFQSDEGPWWSDWSTEKFVRTLPEVPSRGPALWRKLGPPGADGMRNVLLMWKPLKPKEANGEILAYSLSSQRKGEPAIARCVTPGLQCPLLFPAVLGLTFFITARNVMGISPPTKLVIPQADGHEVPPSSFPVFATPAGDHGLRLQWFLPSFPKMGYIFEWGRLPGKQEDGNYWDYQSEQTDHIVITEAIEPGKLYSLKVFAVIDGAVWAVGSTLAYSKQIAPLRAPTLYPIQVWKNQVELQWEELELEEQGGNIQNYSICYEEEGKSKQVVVLGNSVHRYLIEGLAPGSTVSVSLTVSNEGGNTTGPILSICTKTYDYDEAELSLLVLCVGFPFLLLLVSSVACLCKHQRLLKYLWPQIPDPAKSNLATWMPQKRNVQQEWEPKVFLGSQKSAEASWILKNTSPEGENRTAIQEGAEQPQKCTATWNAVEYSTVLVVKNHCGLEEPWGRPCPLDSLLKCPETLDACSAPELGLGVWFQNLSNEAGSHYKALESAGEFPLLVRLLALEGGLHSSECPPQEKITSNKNPGSSARAEKSS